MKAKTLVALPSSTTAGAVTCKLTLMTPEGAQRLLKENTRNRPLSQPIVRKLAIAMTEGRFKINGDTIRVDSKRRLLDGQHRLHAIAHTGVPQWMILVEGLDPSVFDTIDQGKVRSGGDIFAICGVKNSSYVSTSVVILWQWEQGYTLGVGQTRFMPTMDQRVQTFDRHKQLETVVADVVHHRNAMRGVYQSSYAGLHYLFRQQHKPASDRMLRLLAKGGGTATNPIVAVREKCIEIADSEFRRSREAIFAMLRVAWNKFVAGQEWSEAEIPETLDIKINGLTSTRWLEHE